MLLLFVVTGKKYVLEDMQRLVSIVFVVLCVFSINVVLFNADYCSSHVLNNGSGRAGNINVEY